MAKKRRQKDETEEAEGYAFPEFDEKAFIKEEMTIGRATLVAVLVALGFAGLSYALTDANWRVAFAAGGIGGLAATIFIVRMMGVGWEDIQKAGWVGIGGVYFFTWLAVWILAVNPPLVDNSEPLLGDVVFQQRPAGSDDSVNWTTVIQPSQMQPGASTRVIVEITDNHEIDDSSVTLVIDGSTPIQMGRDFKKSGDDHHGFFTAAVSASSGAHTYQLRASDTDGNRAVASGAFAFIG